MLEYMELTFRFRGPTQGRLFDRKDGRITIQDEGKDLKDEFRKHHLETSIMKERRND